MENPEDTPRLKISMISSSAPTPTKRSINGLSLMLSQRISSDPSILPTVSEDADEVPSPPPSAAASAALLQPAPSSRAPAGEGGEVSRVGDHFAQFRSQNFEPDDSAPFSDEWERLTASQGWVPGSQAYKRERARALRNELRACYFPPSSIMIKEEQNREYEEPGIKREEADTIVEEDGGGEGCGGVPLALEMGIEDRGPLAELMGFQAMCRDVGKEPGNTIDECKTALRATLVNIIDLIDSHRTGQPVQVWTDFESFRAYTMQSEKTMPLEEAKKDELLECFLKKIKLGKRRSRNRAGRGVSKRVKTRAPSLGSGLEGERERKRPRR